MIKKSILLLILVFPFILHGYITGIYINKYKADSDNFYYLVDKAIDNGMNAVVIDIKYDRGEIAVMPDSQFTAIGAYSPISGIKEKLSYLKQNNIKSIARIVCFKDKYLGKFENYRYAMRYPDGDVFYDMSNATWVSPYSEFVRQYIIDIACRTAALGFDEIQFDYIRFPSDFPDSTKPRWLNNPDYDGTGRFAVINRFLKEAYTALKPYGVDVSADVFGYTVWLDSISLIGQDIEQMGKYTDILYPMVYPSHFGRNFLNNGNKEQRTYDIIYGSGIHGKERMKYFNTDIILFIQDFDWLSSRMGNDYINNQIKAANESGVAGYILWNPSNNYNYFKLEKRLRGIESRREHKLEYIEPIVR